MRRELWYILYRQATTFSNNSVPLMQAFHAVSGTVYVFATAMYSVVRSVVSVRHVKVHPMFAKTDERRLADSC